MLINANQAIKQRKVLLFFAEIQKMSNTALGGKSSALEYPYLEYKNFGGLHDKWGYCY